MSTNPGHIYTVQSNMNCTELVYTGHHNILYLKMRELLKHFQSECLSVNKCVCSETTLCVFIRVCCVYIQCGLEVWGGKRGGGV